MSVLDGLMDGKAGAAEKPAALPKADDDLISMFLDETETKEKGSDDVDSSIYPDFDAPAPEDYEGQSSPAPGGDAGGGLDGVSPDAQEAMMTLVSLPVETIVDTADITLTELIVRGCKLEDYEGKDEDKLVTSDADKAALVKATERYLDSQQIRVTPLTGLIITVLIVYGKKLMYGLKLKKLVRKQAMLEDEIGRLQDERDEMAIRLHRQAEELEALKKTKETEEAGDAA